MAKKEPLELLQNRDDLLMLMRRLAKQLFVIVPDERDKCKRIFFSQEDADKWFAERDSEDGLTPATAALEFANIDGNGTIPGTEQYQLTCAVVNDGGAAMKGTDGIMLMFNFSTVDRLNNAPLGESVEVSFSFRSTVGTKQVGAMFEYSTEVTKFDITDYLEEGENTITMIIRGRSTGLSRTVLATFTLIDLQLTSDFNIAKAQQESQTIYIPYYTKGSDAKNVQIIIDGQQVDNITVPAGESRDTYALPNTLALGAHTLQMKATMMRNDKQYESNLLYFDFVNNGKGLVLTKALIKAVFPSGTPVFQMSNPGLLGQQFIDYILQWAYFSTQYPSAIVTWKTKINGMEAVVGSREVDEKEGQVDVMPDPVQFQPDQIGTYDLYATIAEIADPIGQFTINVTPNSAGLAEKTTGLSLKLSALGRSNNEPADTRNDWSDNGYKTTFNAAMDFSAVAGYTGKAVRFDGGATGINTCKPFAEENSVLTNGMAMTFHFRTRNVINESLPLIEIGNPVGDDAYFAIYGKKVVLKPSMGETLEYAFASEEDTWLAVVIFPKEFGTDKQMMFFALNGIQAPGKQYDMNAFFRIGSTADTNNQYGMIKMGTTSKEAAIDIYSIRSYVGTLSMWNIMNTYIIDHGGNVGALMKKNNIFLNNSIDTPDTDAIRERFRTIEVIGDLGSLELATAKVSFFGSVIYRDPFNPKFNFERTDGRVWIETAGQSRVSDLMAKSFHVDLNEDENVKTYQDGVLTHKNRVIFAERNVPENAVRIDLCGADSSISRNAAHFKLVNKVYPNLQVDDETLHDNDYPYPLRTPAMHYAYSQYAKDMANLYGGSENDYQFPHDICLAPDSVPVVVLWHKEENDALQVYGIGIMMQEKKAAYANGNHSIYLKERMTDGRLDPYDRFTGVNGQRGWDNEGTIEMEYLRNDDFTENKSADGWNATTREEAFEVSFPKNSDFKKNPLLKEQTWNTFYNEYVEPLARICNDQTTFDREIESVIWMPSFAMYYNKCLDKKCNDSLCRNLHVLRVFIKGKWVWFAKWWDVDVQTGLFQTGGYGVDPATDRQTKDKNGTYVMQGHDVRLWNRLEQNEKFRRWCYALAKASYKAGWTCAADKEEQDKIVGAMCEGLYNLDGLQKFLSAWRKGNNYMIRYQGSSVPYRHGFLNESYAIREAQQAIGDYGKRTIEFYAQTAETEGLHIRAIATQRWWFGLALGETLITTGIIHEPADGEFYLDFDPRTLAREYAKVFGADKMKMADISDYLYKFGQTIHLENLTECEELYVGYPTAERMAASRGLNATTDIGFSGLENLSRLRRFSVMGLMGLQTLDLTTFPLLTHFYGAATGLLAFQPASGTKFESLMLPDTLQQIVCSKSVLGGLGFWHADMESHTITPASCPSSLRYLSLTAMGEDEGSHQLVHQWLEMIRSEVAHNPAYIKSVTITYRNIVWDGISKDDILTLASIPDEQRNLTGYIKTNAVYTAAERATLIAAFGENVFDPNATSVTLVCDGEGDGLSISAVGTTVQTPDESHVLVEQGNTVSFTAAGFPISGSNKENYRWRVWLNGTWLFGSDEDPIRRFGSCTINWLTGELTSEENADEAQTYRISCYDKNNPAMSGEVDVTIRPRSYPTSVNLVKTVGDMDELEGVLQVTELGLYRFRANHTPAGYTGRMIQDTSGFWTLVGADASVISTSTTAVEFTLEVINMPKDDVNLTLRYTSRWRNNLSLTADDVRMAIVTVISQLLNEDSFFGNPVLYHCMQALGIEPEDNWYSNMQMKQVMGRFSVKELCPTEAKSLTSLNSGVYNIMQYLKNVTVLDLSGTGLDDEHNNLVAMPWLTTLDITDTQPTLELQTLLPVSSTIITDGKGASVFVPDGQVKEMRNKSRDMDHTIEYGSDFGKTSLSFADGMKIRYNDGTTVLL